MKSVVGTRQVEYGKQKMEFRVAYANTFDEPVSGLMNALLMEYGQHYRHSEINGRRSLVIDIG